MRVTKAIRPSRADRKAGHKAPLTFHPQRPAPAILKQPLPVQREPLYTPPSTPYGTGQSSAGMSGYLHFKIVCTRPSSPSEGTPQNMPAAPHPLTHPVMLPGTPTRERKTSC
ncbi:hypothetical protein J6590_043796 [Homalodisca vitripennis]|nr:hypothetical protein J6590_043796 [Homalodisca vitripennis]